MKISTNELKNIIRESIIKNISENFDNYEPWFIETLRRNGKSEDEIKQICSNQKTNYEDDMSVYTESLVNEGVTATVDNFDKIAQMINLTDPDKFYYVQIIKRWKDNKDKGMTKDIGDTYHAGGEYGNVASGTAFKVRSGNELQALKKQIMDYCNKNNARAYITSNPRSQSAIDNFMPQYLNGLKRHNHGQLPTYAKHADDILSAQSKEDGSWTDRPRFFFDIDTKDQRIWRTTKALLKHHNVPIEDEYTTPSGGLHIVVADRFSILNIKEVIDDLRVFDGYKDLGRTQTVHANFDGKLILYSNVDTAGY